MRKDNYMQNSPGLAVPSEHSMEQSTATNIYIAYYFFAIQLAIAFYLWNRAVEGYDSNGWQRKV